MSFNLENFKWGGSAHGDASGVVRVSANLSGLKFDDQKFDQSDFVSSLNKALNAWEKVAAVDFESSGGAPGQIQIGTQSLAGSTIGLARVSFSNRSGIDLIKKAEISFDSDEDWAPNGEGGAQNFFAVALHEIGHAFGLGHANDRSEIMNPVISTDDLGDGDIEGAQKMYGTDPDDLDAPPLLNQEDADGPIDPQDADAPTPAPSEEDDDDGGMLGMLLGGLVALILGVFSGGAALAGAAFLALGSGDDPIEVPEYEGSGTTLDELVPTYDLEGEHEVVHRLFDQEEEYHHHHGEECDCCNVMA